MTAADVRMFDGQVYTVTSVGWTGPDPQWVKALNDGYPPHSTTVSDPVLAAARKAAREWDGEVVGAREIAPAESIPSPRTEATV
jgi:hypothetical protein